MKTSWGRNISGDLHIQGMLSLLYFIIYIQRCAIHRQTYYKVGLNLKMNMFWPLGHQQGYLLQCIQLKLEPTHKIYIQCRRCLYYGACSYNFGGACHTAHRIMDA